MMTCPSCGYKEDTKFCKHCGALMVSEAKANYLQTPQFTGITIPPPTATEGFKANDLDALGTEDRDFGDDEHGEGGKDSWFGIGMVLVLVVILIAWGVARATGSN